MRDGLIDLVVSKIDEYRKRGITSMESQVLYNISYRELIGLNPSKDDLNPAIGSIVYEDNYDTLLNTDYYKTVMNYMLKDIYKYTGITLDKWLDMTDVEIDIITDIVSSLVETTNSILKKITDSDKKDMSKMDISDILGNNHGFR